MGRGSHLPEQRPRLELVSGPAPAGRVRGEGCRCSPGVTRQDAQEAVLSLLGQLEHVRTLAADDRYRMMWLDYKRRVLHWIEHHAL